MKEEKKLKKAAALQYKKGTSAPKVVAMGKGIIAEKIIEAAKEHEVAVYEDPFLAQQLLHLELGQEIPEELYQVVAEVLIFIGSIDK